MTDTDPTFGDGQLNEYVDAEKLAAEIGLDEEEIAWRKDFIDFDEQDAQTLEDFADLFEDHTDEIVDSFYDHLLAYEQTRDVIDRSPKDLEALKATQRAYLSSLTRGTYDEGYFQNRVRIGKLHELLDMPLKHYIGQYNVYYRLLLSLVTEQIHDRLAETVEMARGRTHDQATTDFARLTQHLYEDVEEGLVDLHSLLKVLNLDMQVAVDTYTQSRIDDLERERDQFAALFENVPTPVVVVRVVDDGMRVQEVNTAFEELFGYTAADLADRDFEHYLTPPDETPRPIADRDIITNIRTNTESELSEAEVTLETQFGRREFIRVAAPVDTHEFDDLEYAFYIDVTDQKQRQERLQVLSRVLRHDLRNKLNVIRGGVDALRDQPSDTQRDDVLQSIEDASTNLLTTSRKIRRVERLIAGDAERRPIDVNDLVEDVVDGVRDRFPDCDFSVSTLDQLKVRGSKALALAVEEVVENGSIHNDAREARVEVTVTESVDDRYVEIHVGDNGPGIPPAEYEILTGERDRSQTDHTSGFGLWAVNWIVTGAGGTVQFAENSPRGSIVTLRLPRLTGESE